MLIGERPERPVIGATPLPAPTARYTGTEPNYLTNRIVRDLLSGGQYTQDLLIGERPERPVVGATMPKPPSTYTPPRIGALEATPMAETRRQAINPFGAAMGNALAGYGQGAITTGTTPFGPEAFRPGYSAPRISEPIATPMAPDRRAAFDAAQKIIDEAHAAGQYTPTGSRGRAYEILMAFAQDPTHAHPLIINETTRAHIANVDPNWNSKFMEQLGYHREGNHWRYGGSPLVNQNTMPLAFMPNYMSSGGRGSGGGGGSGGYNSLGLVQWRIKITA
jgi:hypothetical protein